MKKIRLSQVLAVFGVLMGLAIMLGMPAEAEAEELLETILYQNPDLKAMLLESLLKWEQEAPKEVKEAIKTLRTGDTAAKIKAAASLGNMGIKAKGAILALAETQKDGTPAANKARLALEKINKSLVEPLLTKLKDNDLYVRVGAAMVLGAIKDPRAVEPLIAMLNDDDLSDRWVAVNALGAIKDPRAIEPLTLH